MVMPFPSKELVFTAKDIPPFHFYKFPDLAEFKMFFWMKSYLRYKRYVDSKFNIGMLPRELTSVGDKVWDAYACFPSTEIWSDEAGNVTLNQIVYYYEGGIITKDNAVTLCEQYIDLLNGVKQFAEQGHKGVVEGTYQLFHNEIVISENNTLLKMGDKRVAMISYNTMNLLTTSQESFCQDVENFMNNLINKSTLISSSGERERNIFFNQRVRKVEQAIESISRS